jgi:hypothetical protein
VDPILLFLGELAVEAEIDPGLRRSAGREQKREGEQECNGFQYDKGILHIDS